MNKRDILFVGISSLEADASQHKLYFLAAALAEQGVKVSVMVPAYPGNVAFLDRIKGDVEKLCFPPGSTFGEMSWKFILAGRGEWSCIYIVGVGFRSLIPRCRFRGNPRIIQDFDELPSYIDTFSKFRRSYFARVENFLWHHADGFVCASEFLVARARRHRPGLGQKILKMPVAISPGEHHVDPDIEASIRLRHRQRPLLLYVGSMHRFYQVGELIELAKTLRRRRSPAFIRVLGGGPDLGYFKAEVEIAAVGNWIGFEGPVRREELATHMAAADVLLFPFHDTPFNVSRCPTKAFHYAAANRPVVTNRLAEVETLLGESAFYYREADIEHMADACARALQARPGFSNSISFHTLTWDNRAEVFLRWLNQLGWLGAIRSPLIEYA